MAEAEMSSAPRRSDAVTLEVVIPVFNESTGLAALLERLDTCFSAAACARHGLAEVRFLFVDDGSTDRSASVLAEAIRGGFPATLFRLSRNFGHQAAVSAGLSESRAEIVAVMDADLQDPPEVLFEMVDAWREGADVAYAVRRGRKENFAKRAGYFLFYRLYRYLSEVDVPLDSGDFALLDRRVVDAMEELPEHLRFLRGLRTWVGFHQVPVPYERAAREYGRSKYGWSKLYQLATDGIAAMSVKPLRIVQFALITSALVTVLLGGGLVVAAAVARTLSPTEWWGMATILAILATSSLNLVCLYILSAYIGRTYLEAKARPAWIVREVVRQSASAGR